jgi:hypothetical protein
MSLFRTRFCGLCALLALLSGSIFLPGAEAQKKAAPPVPDVLVLNDGVTLRGTLVRVVDGTVTFHTASLGDVTVAWSKVKELHTSGQFSVLNKAVKVRGKRAAGEIPTGRLDGTSATVTVHPAHRPGTQAAAETIPAKSAEYIVDEQTLHQEMFHEPGFFAGWSGSATAGATIVSATQNQYTVTGALGLVRTVPSVTWLNSRNRTSTDFSGSFGKITQPGYASPAGYVPETVTKTAILHFDAERDQYVSPRFFALAQTAFDHNYSQNLSLQQIYGGGMGWTALKTPKQEADLKATVQYEKQSFITGGAAANQNLVGSTLAGNYTLHLKFVTVAQQVAYIPAFNNMHAYSTNETNLFTFPAYKKLGFSVGTTDSYLNDPPVSLPPTKRNSFQFTMGLTYTIQ